MVQWVIFHVPKEGGPGSIPGQGIRSHIPQLRVHMPQLKIPYFIHRSLKHTSCHIFTHFLPTQLLFQGDLKSCWQQSSLLPLKTCPPIVLSNLEFFRWEAWAWEGEIGWGWEALSRAKWGFHVGNEKTELKKGKFHDYKYLKEFPGLPWWSSG